MNGKGVTASSGLCSKFPENPTFAAKNTPLLKKIAGTTIARFLNALLNIAVVATAARAFGAEGYGTVVLLILGIAVIQLFNNVVGGSALVYLTSRQNIFSLLLPAYLWGLLTAAAGANLLSLFELIPPVYRRETMMLALLSNWITANMMILIGKEKIRTYNLITVLQTLLVFGSILVFVHGINKNHIDYYIYALYLSYVITFFVSGAAVSPHLRITDLSSIGDSIKPILHYGGLMQLANILQFFSYRLSYYMLEKFYDKPELGRFAVGVQIAEGLWLIAKSIALVQYSRIANEPDNPEYAKKITLIFLKITTAATLLLYAILLLLPQVAFSFVFGSDFSDTKLVILLLGPGILAVAACQMLSHYFSGIGKPGFNTISSGIGFAAVLFAGLLLIPSFGIAGAAVATTFSYVSIFLYQLFWFKRVSKCTFMEMCIGYEDVRLLRSEISRWFSGSKH